MKKLFLFLITAIALWSCTGGSDGISGTWKYENGKDLSTIIFKDSSYFYEHKYTNSKENTDIDSGTYKVIEDNIYEFRSLSRRHNGTDVRYQASDHYRITHNEDGSLTVLPGRLYTRGTGAGNELLNSSFYTIIPQGEYNNTFVKYVFTADSVKRYQGYSQTNELADSLYKPYLYNGVRMKNDIFTTIRTAPDGKEYTEDFRFYFIGSRLFFGKDQDVKVFLKR